MGASPSVFTEIISFTWHKREALQSMLRNLQWALVWIYITEKKSIEHESRINRLHFLLLFLKEFLPTVIILILPFKFDLVFHSGDIAHSWTGNHSSELQSDLSDIFDHWESL